MLSRRHLLTGAATMMAFGGLARLARAESLADAAIRDTYNMDLPGYGPLLPDPAGIFDLPEGFSYRVVSRAGSAMQDGFILPHKFDGMGCFALDAQRVILVRNHELGVSDSAIGAFGKGGMLQDRFYDSGADGLPLAGGTTTLVYDLARQKVETEFLSLAGTMINCAGGTSLQRGWLSCEESTAVKGKVLGKDHGWVFEVPADLRGLADPLPLTGMGRFRHEAVALDPRTGIAYLTEDEPDGLFYRYLPHDVSRLAAGGRLQALALWEMGDSRNWDEVTWRQGEWRSARWIDLDDVDNPQGDLRARGAAAGAALFARGEGIHFGNGELYFTCTTGGAGKLGQILRYRPSPAEGQAGETETPGALQLFVESGDRTKLHMGDNLAVSPWGHLFVCEDKNGGGANHLRGVTPEGRLYTIGCNPAPDAKPGADAGSTSELAGVCFSPDGRTLFVNIYYPGMTLAITGPWARFKA